MQECKNWPVAYGESVKKKVVAALILGVLAILALFFFLGKRKEPETRFLTLYGNVDIRQVDLGFRVPGRLEKMLFEEGDTVAKGQAMAFLDDRPYQESAKKAEAERNAVGVALKNADTIYKRRELLVQTRSVSLENYDDSLAAKAELEAKLKEAQAAYQISCLNLQDTAIYSPSDGVILTRVQEPGTILQAGGPVYVLSLFDPIWVRAYVSEPDLGKIYPGIQATIYTDSGGVYKGQVGFISPQAEFTPKNVETTSLRTDLVYRLRIIVENRDKALRQGMPVTVRIELNEL